MVPVLESLKCLFLYLRHIYSFSKRDTKTESYLSSRVRKRNSAIDPIISYNEIWKSEASGIKKYWVELGLGFIDELFYPAYRNTFTFNITFSLRTRGLPREGWGY